jgi:predicted transcriptional regulator
VRDEKLAKHEVEKPSWTFLTNHGHVLLCICSDPAIRGRDIAAQVGITERAAQAIIADLVNSGYVLRRKVGRRNHYLINPDQPFRHPVEQAHRIGELLQLLTDNQAALLESSKSEEKKEVSQAG